jgi:transposase
MSRPRRNFSAEQKAQIVRRHLSGKEPVSKLAEELLVQPTLIHGWVNQVLAQAARAFERSAGNGRAENAKDARIEHLEAKLVQKNEVIAELLEANVREKKRNGVL